MSHEAAYLASIRGSYPDLVVDTFRSHNRDGQFNDILIVNEDLIFRFPRSPHVAAAFAVETALLQAVQPYLSLPVPNPIYTNLDAQNGMRIFMGYRMIPGEPLRNETLAAIRDEVALDRLAMQLATFLRELHAVPAPELGVELQMRDGPDGWADMYAAFRDRLFPYMRPDAREQVTQQFDAFLGEPRHFQYQPALRHGDFGAGNILYDPETRSISGVIDFGFAGLGDPAVDIAAISTTGEPFFRRLYAVYPGIPAMLERAHFYRGTYALQQALYALRDGDQESFEDGIARYV
jgi:aminoglycoside 2''-phosphotransferase